MNTEEIWKTVRDGRRENFLAGTGRMGEAILSFDWGSTSIGPLSAWPQSLRSVVQTAVLTRQAICLFWGKDLNIIYNDAYAPILGEKEAVALGQPAEKIWSDVWDDIAPIIQEALSGRGTWGENMPLVMTRNGYEEETYWSFSYSPLYADDGTIAGMINITTDTTAAVQTKMKLEQTVDEAATQIQAHVKLDAQRRVVQKEMAHRIKNILSITMAIVSQTLRRADSIEGATDAIFKRLLALSNAQDVLVEAGSEEADVTMLINEVLRAHLPDTSRLRLSGPPTIIPAQAALGMALAINELATNATKYGALSNDVGTVSITWMNAPDGEFGLEWREQGGPVVAPPVRTGFGSRLMNRIVPGYFAGKGQTHFEPSGFRYTLSGVLTRDQDATSLS